jgi:hypothetical protein
MIGITKETYACEGAIGVLSLGRNAGGSSEQEREGGSSAHFGDGWMVVSQRLYVCGDAGTGRILMDEERKG